MPLEDDIRTLAGRVQGEKVDYAIMSDDVPVILIECKKVSDNLSSDKRISQLFRYFGTTKARIGVLTNGILYQFFSDLESPNVMDTSPFLEVDLENLDAGSLGSVVKLNYQIGDSFISVIPAKAGIQSLSMPQNDLPMETPEFRLSPE